MIHYIYEQQDAASNIQHALDVVRSRSVTEIVWKAQPATPFVSALTWCGWCGWCDYAGDHGDGAWCGDAYRQQGHRRSRSPWHQRQHGAKTVEGLRCAPTNVSA